MVEKEEHYLDEVESLRHRVHTLNRMSTKEGANTEYLKNVVMTYMLTSRSSDAASRYGHMMRVCRRLTFDKSSFITQDM